MTKQDCIDVLNRAGYERTDSGAWYQPGLYYLAHGEYARPLLYVRRRKAKEYGIKIKYFYYPGTFYAGKDHFFTEEEIYYLSYKG